MDVKGKPVLQLPSDVGRAMNHNTLFLYGWIGLELVEWTYNNAQIQSWNNLLQTLQLRFAPSQFEHPKVRY